MTGPEQNAAERMRCWPWVLAVVAGLVALVVSLPASSSAESQPAKPQETVGDQDKLPAGQDPAVYWQRKVEEKLASYRAKGEPVTWEELLAARNDVPADKNAALAVQKCFEKLGSLDLGFDVDIWVSGMAQWGVDCSPQSLKLCVGYIDRFKGVFADLERGGRLAQGVYPIASLPLDDFETQDYHSSLRASRRFLALAARFDMQEGKSKDAVAKLIAIRRLSASLGECWTWADANARHGLDAYLVETLENCLSVGQIPGEDLAALQVEMASEEKDANLRHAFYGQRAVSDSQFHQRSVEDMVSTMFADIPDSLRSELSKPGRAAQEKWLYYSMLDRMMDIAGLPVQEQAAAIPGLREKQPKSADELKDPGALARQCEPFSRMLFFYEVWNIARLRVARVALAVERYRLAHGAWPDTLAATVPAFIEAVPIDPYSGQPIVYRRTEEGPILYSVGPNRRDDGGKASDPRTGDILDIPFRLSQGDERPMHTTSFREEPKSLEILEKLGMTKADFPKAGLTEQDIKNLEEIDRMEHPKPPQTPQPNQDENK